jgi:hypothetical protein
MSSQSIVCGTCGAAVPYGRLSCPACGELLASVVGAARRPVAVQRAPKRAARTARATTADATPAAASSVAVAPPAPAPQAVTAEAAIEAMPAPPSPATPSVLVDVPGHATPPTAATAAMPYELGSSGWDQVQPTTDIDIDPEPQWPAERPATPFAAAPAPTIEMPQNGAPPAFARSSFADAPGAYVPPVIPVIPAGPPAPARAWAGHPGTDDAPSDTEASSSSSAGALVDAARLPEFVGWLAVAGSAMAAVGFVLPWGISVIGGSGVGYFDRWGFAGPFHPIVVLGLLAILGLALVRNPIPLWVRVGVPGIALGALLLGLVWPYLFYLPGTGPGVLVVGVGAIILLVAGIIALVADRHDREDRVV